MATTTPRMADEELEVISSNSHHAIIGTLSKLVAYSGQQFDGWHCWELFTGLEGVLPTVVSRGSTVRFPDQGTRLFKIACFLTPADGSNTLRLTIAESGGEVVSLVAVSGPQPSAFFKFMNKNKSVSTIKRHRKEQSNPEMDELGKNQRARLPHVHGHLNQRPQHPPRVPQHAPRAPHPELAAVPEDFRRREEALAEQMAAEETQHSSGGGKKHLLNKWQLKRPNMQKRCSSCNTS